MVERWQEIARELGDYEMRDSWSGASMERCKPGDYPGDWVKAETACKRIAELQDRIAELEALIGACHEAMGEDAGSDDASLPEVIAHYVRESNEEIAELEAAMEQTKAEAHKGFFEAYEKLLEERGDG